MRLGFQIALLCFFAGITFGAGIDENPDLELAMRQSEKAAAARGEKIGFIDIAPAMVDSIAR